MSRISFVAATAALLMAVPVPVSAQTGTMSGSTMSSNTMSPNTMSGGTHVNTTNCVMTASTNSMSGNSPSGGAMSSRTMSTNHSKPCPKPKTNAMAPNAMGAGH